jgi:hypothetical protein
MTQLDPTVPNDDKYTQRGEKSEDNYFLFLVTIVNKASNDIITIT